MSGLSNIDEFNSEVTRLAQSLPAEAIVKFQRVVAFQAMKRLMARMPVGNPDLWKANALAQDISTRRTAVDSQTGLPLAKKSTAKGYVGKGYVGGHARHNLQLEIGDFPQGELGGVDAAGSGALTRALAKLAQLPPFALVVIADNVPYIEPLEHGHSTQAPSGMFEVTFQELITEFQAAEA